VQARRQLVVTADDFGIGPATSHGILDLAAQGRVTCTVLLVNSPHADQAVRAWRQAGATLELGWHPCLTLDRPVLSAAAVPSLVDEDGRFLALGPFLRRLCLGDVNPDHLAAELHAQYGRFLDLVGHAPAVINAHHHVQAFAPVGSILLDLLARQRPRPYVRRLRESWRTLRHVPGARGKRAVLSALGGRLARRQRGAGFPGNDYLVGISDPVHVADPAFLVRWLRHTAGGVVELMCHPGHPDRTLLGRDATPADGQLERRVQEYHLLRQPQFLQACADAGFTLAAPSGLAPRLSEVGPHAA
jgi:predicted glycoside hydrolase/deacetylase ChbG (UPF0249 family)